MRAVASRPAAPAPSSTKKRPGRPPKTPRVAADTVAACVPNQRLVVKRATAGMTSHDAPAARHQTAAMRMVRRGRAVMTAMVGRIAPAGRPRGAAHACAADRALATPGTDGTEIVTDWPAGGRACVI